MSCILCEVCQCVIDTDYNVECFIGDGSEAVCEVCQVDLVHDGRLVELADGGLVWADSIGTPLVTTAQEGRE